MNAARLPAARWLLALAAAALVAAGAACARESSSTIAAAQLPNEAREVLARVRAGGPFDYDRDGVVFGNREGLLPKMPRGHYLEYTVKTPGERTRGARRIVCGGPPREPQACWYTDDHYASFRKIRE